MTWSAKQYSAFEKERTRPARDLVAAIRTQEVRHAVDLGCGPGNSTEVLAEHFPKAIVTGMDSSEDMVAAARQRLPEMRFELANIETWNPEKQFDVILANASLQWLPNHAELYPRLASKLSAGGSLAIQTPDNLEEPAHRLARRVASDGPWASKLAQVKHPARHTSDFYYQLLLPHCAVIDIWRTTYFHPLAGGPAAVVEWFKGTALRPYLEPLDANEKMAFLNQYLAAITEAYPSLPNGTVLLPFPRLFIVANR
jgi:trans-aconitate 2-methyltransferase